MEDFYAVCAKNGGLPKTRFMHFESKVQLLAEISLPIRSFRIEMERTKE